LILRNKPSGHVPKSFAARGRTVISFFVMGGHMRLPWVSRKTLEATDNMWRETLATCNRAIALVEKAYADNTDLRVAKDVAEKVVVDADQEFLRQVGIKKD
jgi:hypothetical protein